MKSGFKTISPIDNSVYVEREYASEKQIDQALSAAVSAQEKWKQIPVKRRAEICTGAVRYFEDNEAEIAEEITWQMGRPIRYSPWEISGGFIERATYMIKIAESVLADLRVEKTEGFNRFIRKEPLGTVFVAAPWNYPYLTSVNSIFPALMAGNAVILKHAQQTPLCAERYAEAFKAAELPEGVFQYLHLQHEQAGRVVRDHRIDFVAFTGSVNGGKAVLDALGSRFINTGMELGGKDPAYVCADADIEDAVANLVDGSFFNSGQSCCGIERIYVHDSVHSKFTEAFEALTLKYQLGNPMNPETTLGPMVRASATHFVQQQIKHAVQQGAKAIINPKNFDGHKTGTAYMAPQILLNADHRMDIMKEESFAPVVGIMAVKNDEQAVELMNDSKYGLTASIWTADMDKAIKIGNQVHTGTFYANRCDYLDPALAWTGVKNSGKGCTLSSLGYDSLSRPKSFHLKEI